MKSPAHRGPTPALPLVALAAALLAGCASLSSEPLLADAPAITQGLVYHLPRRDILVTVNVKDDAGTARVERVDIAPGSAYADTGSAYVLQLQRSLIGNSKIDLGVSVDGLLSKADASHTPKLLDALNAIAEEAGKVGTKALATPAPGTNPCALAGAHAFRIPLRSHAEDAQIAAAKDPLDPYRFVNGEFTTPICGCAMKVVVRELAPVPAGALAAAAAAQVATVGPAGADAQAGVYYRQSRPFEVRVEPAAAFGLHATAIVLSPTRSPTRFLPYARTLFAQSSVTSGFVAGEPQSLVEDVEGEAVALLKLPAALLRAYFAAAGAVFEGFQARDASKGEAAAQDLKLQLVKQKVKSCLAVLAKAPVDTALLQSLGCNEE